MAGAGLPAHVPVSKFDDHLPLYRQSEIFARMGADIPDSTLVDWCGRAMQPLIERIDAAVLASDLLHADGRPIRVPDRSLRGRGLGKGVKKGRIRACVRDRRPCSGMAPPLACHFAPDWTEEHLRHHLRGSRGISRADGCTGYARLCLSDAGGSPARFREAACRAHLRRDFHDVWQSTRSGIARKALDRIGACTTSSATSPDGRSRCAMPPARS